APAVAPAPVTAPATSEAARAVLGAAHPGPDRVEELGIDLRRTDVVPLVDEEVVHLAADLHVLPERDRALLRDDDLGAAADLREPVAELLGVAHRRRERD